MVSRGDKSFEDLGSFAGRKFILTLTGLITLVIVTFASLIYPAMAAVFPTFVGGLLGLLSLYFTGNVINKYIVGKNVQAIETVGAEPESSEGEGES